MSEKRSIWNNPFGGLFDFNRDGKESLGELWLAQKIFEECMKDEEEDGDFADDFCDDELSDYDNLSDSDDLYDNEEESDEYEWRDFCEDGTEYGIDPEDYETEEEFREVLCEVLKKPE